MDEIQTWQQGRFIDQPQYHRMGDDWKSAQSRKEKLLVRLGQTGNAICEARDPDTAIWIAERLNRAAQLENAVAIVRAAMNTQANGGAGWMADFEAAICKRGEGQP